MECFFFRVHQRRVVEQQRRTVSEFQDGILLVGRRMNKTNKGQHKGEPARSIFPEQRAHFTSPPLRIKFCPPSYYGCQVSSFNSFRHMEQIFQPLVVFV